MYVGEIHITLYMLIGIISFDRHITAYSYVSYIHNSKFY